MSDATPTTSRYELTPPEIVAIREGAKLKDQALANLNATSAELNAVVEFIVQRADPGRAKGRAYRWSAQMVDGKPALVVEWAAPDGGGA